MNPHVRSIYLLIILMLSVLIAPVFMGASMLDLPEEVDDLTDGDVEGDDFLMLTDLPLSWIRIPVHQMLVLFRLGLSIFTLFVVYLGGRSKHRRFNDRTLDHVNVLIAESLKTALVRAVFNFLFPAPHLNCPSKQLVNRFLPILIPNIRRS